MADTAPERVASAQFIRELWGICPSDWIVEFNLLQYRPTQEKHDDQRMRALFYRVDQVLADWPTISNQLDHLNRTQVENIHHGVNPRFQKPRKHGKNSDVSHYVAVWVDVDFHGQEAAVRKQFDEVVADLRARGLGPSVIVESGRGLHAYWLFDKPYPVAQARPICAGIQDYFKISDAVHDPRRILRVPGFANLKDSKNPCWCRVAEATWERFPIELFKDFAITDLKKSNEDLEAEEEQRATADITSLKSRDPKLQEALSKGVDESGGPHGGRHLSATAVVGYFCRFSKTKRIAETNAGNWNKKLCRPPLPDDEVQRMVEDFWAKEEVRRAEYKEERRLLKEKEKELKGGPDDGPPWWKGDEFLPEELARHICSQQKIIATPIGDDYKGVTLYVYRSGVYRSKLGSSIETEVRDALARDAKPDRINQVLDLIHRSQKIDYDEINPLACELINVQNGMLDWRTEKIVPHDPKYLSTIQISAEYAPEVRCEALDKFFEDVFPPDCVALAEEFVGYLLIPDTRLQKAFIAVGAGGNGKGTFLKILTSLLGKENVSTLDIHTLEDDKFATAALVGKLANVHHDLSRKQLESTSRFKTLVSGDPISGEKKFKDGFTFRPFARLVFSANEFPRSEDKTNAYFRRLIFVEFPNSFSGAASEILDYDKVLTKTPGFMSALLNRGIAGLRRVMDSGRFSISETSTRTIEQYKRECNSAYDFVQEFCHIEEWGWIPRQQMYQKYDGWCRDNGLKPMSSKNFVNGIRDTKGIKEVKREGVRGWLGISWTNGSGPHTSQEEVETFGKERKVSNEF